MAGWAEAACIGGMAAGTPAAGRLVDRFGTRVVLELTGVAHVLSLVMLAVATFGWLPGHAAVFLSLAAVAGATVPPAGPVIRVAWNDLVPAEDLPRVNALESTLSHAFYVAGAGVVALATWLGQLGYLFLASSVLNAAGVALLLRCAGAVHLPRRGRAAALTAVFRQPGAPRVLLAIFGWAWTLAGLEYAVIGWCTATDRVSFAGVLIGVTAIGAMAASAVLGGRHAGKWSRVRTSTWMFLWALALVPLALVAQHDTALWLITAVAVMGRLPSVGGFTGSDRRDDARRHRRAAHRDLRLADDDPPGRQRHRRRGDGHGRRSPGGGMVRPDGPRLRCRRRGPAEGRIWPPGTRGTSPASGAEESPQVLEASRPR